MVGDLLVEPAMNKVSGDLGAINLRPQVMDLLVFLASNEGQVVSVDDLVETLWPGKVVTDGTLYNSIRELRQAIATLDDTRPYIENIPKKGYRLAVAVANLQESSSAPAVEDKQDRVRLTVRTKIVLAMVCGLMVVASAVYFLVRPHDVRSIAILPFEDISPAGDQAYLANGIADELRLELQRLDGMRVAGRTSSIAYAQEDSKTIGELLNVDFIVEGSIRKEDGNVRITAQLTNAAEGFAIWSQSYSRKLESIFEMQEEIATSVAGALGVRLGVGTINAFRGAGTRNFEAYELYLQTQNYDWTTLAVAKKTRLLQRAVELDPDYAAAWSLLGGLTFATAWDVMPEQTPEIVDRAYSFALRGVRLNPESATAHSMLGHVRCGQFDWIGAEESHMRAMELLSDRPIAEAYAWTVIRSGRMEYAQSLYRMAQSLEPLDGRAPGQSWHANVAQGRFAEAFEITDSQGEPDIFEDNLDIAFNEGDPEKLKAAMRAMPDTYVAFSALFGPILADYGSPERILSMLRDIHQNEDLQWVRKLHDLAIVAAYFGDPQFALKVKGEDVRANVLRMSALWYPVMSDVRRLPEFKALVIELNLVEYWRAYGWSDFCRPLGDEDFECF